MEYHVIRYAVSTQSLFGSGARRWWTLQDAVGRSVATVDDLPTEPATWETTHIHRFSEDITVEYDPAKVRVVRADW